MTLDIKKQIQLVDIAECTRYYDWEDIRRKMHFLISVLGIFVDMINEIQIR